MTIHRLQRYEIFPVNVDQRSFEIEELKGQMQLDPDGLAKRLLDTEAKVVKCEEVIAKLLNELEELRSRLKLNSTNSSIGNTFLSTKISHP